MSAHELRNTVREKLMSRISDEQTWLADRTDDTEPQFRVRQGHVKGLKEAEAILADVYREMH